MKRGIRQTNLFKRDLKKIMKRANDMAKLYSVVDKLARGERLEKHHRPHKLIENYAHKMECHIEPDWLLIYEIKDEVVILYRTGTHADLF